MPEVSGPTQKEGAAEGGAGNWGEVVTRQPYRKVRLDHLLSKEEEVGIALLFRCQGALGKRTSSKNEQIRKTNRFEKRIDSFEKRFRWRCVEGKHPYPYRTRWLRPLRPMVLCWKRHGRAGGCRIYKLFLWHTAIKTFICNNNGNRGFRWLHGS